MVYAPGLVFPASRKSIDVEYPVAMRKRIVVRIIPTGFMSEPLTDYFQNSPTSEQRKKRPEKSWRAASAVNFRRQNLKKTISMPVNTHPLRHPF